MSNVSIKPRTRAAYDLFHQGSLALAEAEFNGIRCDLEYCQRIIPNLDRQQQAIKAKFLKTELGRAWHKRYKAALNLDSDPQLRQVLYGDLKAEETVYTKGGKSGNRLPAVSAKALQESAVDGVSVLLDLRDLQSNTNFLKNIYYQAQADGKIHPFFHLSPYGDFRDGGARSFRGSSSDPNFQNNPNRKVDSRKLVRRSLIPRPGHRIVGRDYGSMEFRISACLHQDPNMIRYIEHNDDPHRDTAAKCYLLDPVLCTKKYGDAGKAVRSDGGKNGFTFPQMYFQDPPNTARALWAKAQYLKHPADLDKTIVQHLSDRKLRTYEAFEQHIVKKAVPWFWQEMFPAYGKWRERWLADYDKRGYFDMLTGFRIEGVMSRYQLGNYPIQGPAFHCLLWSLTRVWEMWKGKSDWRSLIVGQIHDELTTDEHAGEFEENQVEVPKIMAEDIRKEWPWIIVPLEVETDATGVDENWYMKKEVR